MNTATSIGAHELALTIISTGEGYDHRCHLARQALTVTQPGSVSSLADQWALVARQGARLYERAHGSPGASCFTVVDILGAGVELAEYYDTHIRELIACENEAKGE